jgi:putative ABC transport system permease protein
MEWLREIIVLTRLNLLTLSQRVANSMVTVVGVACVVGVFVAVLSLAAGLKHTVASVGSEGNAIILSRGAASEFNSSISLEQERVIAELSGVRHGVDGKLLLSPEYYIAVSLADSSVTLRGVTLAGLRVRKNVKIVEGRAFREGTNEIVVGRQIRGLLGNPVAGQTLRIGDASWQVVGILDEDGSESESEIWCDLAALQGHFRQTGVYQSVRMSLEPGRSVADIQAQMDKDQRLRRMVVHDEREYFASQSGSMSSFIEAVGYPLALVMIVGAVIAVINTMYASVSARTVEIATLRAIGYEPFAVGVATLFESMLLALVGGLIGAILVYLALNGYTVNSMSRLTNTQVIFGFAVTPELVARGLITALVVGLFGGFFPALRASRLSVASGLRDE